MTRATSDSYLRVMREGHRSPYESVSRAQPARASGWVTFAGTVLAVAGIINVIYGIAAISGSRFFAGDAKYILSDLHTWGWIVLMVGAIQAAAGAAIWGGLRWGRWVGIASASVNAIVQLLWMPAYPLLALTVFVVDLLALYGLTAYGGRKTA